MVSADKPEAHTLTEPSKPHKETYNTGVFQHHHSDQDPDFVVCLSLRCFSDRRGIDHNGEVDFVHAPIQDKATNNRRGPIGWQPGCGNTQQEPSTLQGT